MSGTVHDIPLLNFLALGVPAAAVLVVLFYWNLNLGKTVYALARMLAQLLAIGYVLAYIFEVQSALLVLLVLTFMLGAATWISLNPLKSPGRPLYVAAFIAIFVAGGLVLTAVTQGVLQITPWYDPRQMIPLAGMIFSSAMTAISLCAERLSGELERRVPYKQARASAFNTSLIPTINSLFAVGLVSLPGMMTGQILSGVAPPIAAKYQIVVMIMLFSSVGLASIIFLFLSKKHFMALYSSPDSSPDAADPNS